MAYVPTIDDLPPEQNSGYIPSADDLPPEVTQPQRKLSQVDTGKSVLSRLANSDAVNAVLGLGDSTVNYTTDLINKNYGTNIKPMKSGSGTAYDYASYLGPVLPLAALTEAGGATLGAAEGLPFVGRAASYLIGGGPSGVLRRMLGIGLLGAAENPNNRITGATEYAVASPIMDAGGKFIAEPIANMVTKGALKAQNALAYLRDQFKKGLALSPQDTALNVIKNYGDISKGNVLPVDIGTATGNAQLAQEYNNLLDVPGSGAAENKAIVEKAQAQNQISQLQKDYQIANKEKNNLEYLYSSSNNRLLENNDQLNKPILDENFIPDHVNSLMQGLEDPSKINETTKPVLTKMHKDILEQAKENFRPLNNSNIDLNEISGPDGFSNYKVSAKELLDKRKDLMDLFNSSSDLGSSLNSEISKAESMLGLSEKAPPKDIKIPFQMPDGSIIDLDKAASGDISKEASLPNVISRIQTLNKMAANAYGQSRRAEGRVLSNLADSLKTDTKNLLQQNGNGDLANQLELANNHYRTSVVPFYSNPEIEKTVTDSTYIPQKDKLSKALFDSNNSAITASLPKNLITANISNLLNKGTQSVSGLTRLNEKQILNNYNGLSVQSKNLIKQFSPQTSNLLENAPSIINQRNSLQEFNQDMQNSLSKQQDEVNKIQQKLIDAKDKYYKTTGPATGKATLAIPTNPLDMKKDAVHTLLNILKSPIGKSYEQALTNPNLLKAYIGMEPFRPSLTANLIASSPRAVLTSALSNANQQRKG